MDAHNHAFVHRVVGFDEHAATVVELAQGVGENFTRVHGNQHAVFASANVTFVWLVAVKDVGNQARATGQVQKLVGKANQAARRNAVFQAHTATAVRLHVHQLALAFAQGLHHAALVGFFNVGGHQFDRLVLVAIDLAEHDTWLGHGQLVAFAAHVLQQNSQVQLAATHDFKNTFFVGFFDAQRDIVLQLFLQAVPDLAASHILAFATGQRAGVDAKVHGQRGLVHLQHRQGRRVGRVGDGDANADVGNAVDQHNFARTGFAGLHALQTLEGQDLVDTAFDRFAVRAFHHHHVHHRFDRALADAAHADAAHKSGEVERRNLQLQRRGGVAFLRRHVRQDRVKQGRHVWAPLLTGFALNHRRPAVNARGIDHRKIELLIGGAQFVKQVKGGVDHKVGARAGFVHLVDHQNGLEAQGQRLFGHKTGLRHGAFLRVDQQHHAVDHAQGAFHFTAKVGVSGGVDDVDVRAFPGHGAVLGQNRDATLFFNRVVVHHGVNHFFVLGKGAGLAQELVHHGGFAMVNVGDDGDVADLLATHVSLSFNRFKFQFVFNAWASARLCACTWAISIGLNKRPGINSPAFTWPVPNKAAGAAA